MTARSWRPRPVLLPVTLRHSMRLRVGDQVTLSLPAVDVRRVAVSGFVDEPMGSIAYTSLDQLAGWTGATAPEAAASAVALQRSVTDAFSLYDILVVLMGP